MLVVIDSLFIQGCSRQPAVLSFASDLHTPRLCGPVPGNEAFHVDAFAFFVSNVRVRINDNWRQVDFIPGETQTAHTALINLTPNCDAQEQTRVNIPLALTHHEFSRVEELEFSIAVPFETNHANPLAQPPPLSDTTMFWSWQRGHKFVRFDLSNQQTGEQWAFHLGSVGCESASAVRAPVAACAEPHRYIQRILKNSGTGIVFVKATQWLQGIPLSSSTGCMFNQPPEENCAKLVERIQQPWMQWFRT